MSRFFRLYVDAVFVWPVWIVWGLTSTLAVIADPFDKPIQFTSSERLVFWPTVVTLAIIVGIAGRVIVREYVYPRASITQVVLIAIYACSTLTPLIVLVLAVLMPGFMPTNHDVAKLVFYVFAVSIVTSILRRMATGEAFWRRQVSSREPPRIFDRLDPPERGSLFRMQVRDHYVDVITCQGRKSVLIRFSDAIAEVETVPGCRVHRSHWVAAHAVTGSRSEKNKCWVITADGAEIPVSRTYRAEAEAAGILSATGA
ncbi:LytTR family DNA-binding domain-containing protein [Thioclava sp. A2]|uniref:LytTR family DNA-binding domain-containing protein n=1 Tax=Thioclava sp. FCG-A2 TaxID=3080562 RepID=UPI002953A1F0|nr:LytTR family DNA-binding domain-containing protein [Thioclava sp. A2]MDV7271703.1 LytTR family DNA-binding domain-containing protein [Thioclava sp. A2]